MSREATNPGPKRCPDCKRFMAYTPADGFWCDLCPDPDLDLDQRPYGHTVSNSTDTHADVPALRAEVEALRAEWSDSWRTPKRLLSSDAAARLRPLLDEL